MEGPEVLGVDIGGVILDWSSVKDTNLSFSGENYLKTPALPGVFEALHELNSGRFQDHIFLVSKHDHFGPGRMLEWLEHHDFYNRTGILKDHLNFCTERAEKAAICKKLDVQYFIDDRLEVLSHLIGVVPNLYLFRPSEKEVEEFHEFLSEVTRVEGWEELTNILL